MKLSCSKEIRESFGDRTHQPNRIECKRVLPLTFLAFNYSANLLCLISIISKDELSYIARAILYNKVETFPSYLIKDGGNKSIYNQIFNSFLL